MLSYAVSTSANVPLLSAVLRTVAVTRAPSTLTDSDTITNASLVLPRSRVQKAESAQFCRRAEQWQRLIRRGEAGRLPSGIDDRGASISAHLELLSLEGSGGAH